MWSTRVAVDISSERRIFRCCRHRPPGLARALARHDAAGWGTAGSYFHLVCSIISVFYSKMCVFFVICGCSRSSNVLSSGPTGRGPKCSRRGAPEISRASSCSNDGPCTLAWCIKLARGMFLCTHHLDCGCCFTLSAEYFWAPATGRQGWPARAWRRGLDTAAAGWGAGGRIVFLQYDLVLLCSDKKCVSFA